MIGVGQTVGAYTLLSRIGVGDLGEVFLAEHRHTGREVAVKVLLPELSTAGPALDRFLDEMRAIGPIRDPGVVDILDVDVGGDGRAFVVMEVLDGESLGSYLGRTGPLSGDLPFTLAMGMAAARALGAAHESGIVHRGLTPDSLFLHVAEASGRATTVKILDFGAAALATPGGGPGEAIPRTARQVGSSAYMSPEQIQGARPVDARSDVYSLGCILYEALGGSPPFVGETPVAILAAHILHEPPPLAARVRDLPPELGKLIVRMLSKSPEARPTMREVEAALVVCAEGIGVAMPRGLSPRIPVKRRNPSNVPSVIPEDRNKGAVGAVSANDVGAKASRPSSGPATTRAPVRLDENVQFTVRRPKVVAPGHWHKLLAFAHLSEKRADAPPEEPNPIEEVERQAEQMLGADASDHPAATTDSDTAIPEEGELTFIPVVPGIDFNPRSVTFHWVKPVHGFSFEFRAPAELDRSTTRGAVHVFLGNVIVAEISVAITVDSTRVDAARAQNAARPYRKIFASYSHKDLGVVEEFRTYAQALGDRYVLDCVDLRAGEVWNEAIAKLIKDADVFQLFWSRNSMHSPYVRQEWEFALSLGDRHRVRPTYWEDPLPEGPGLPPEALKRLHFQRIVSRSASAAAPASPASPDGAASKQDPAPAPVGAPAPAPKAVPVPMGAPASAPLATPVPVAAPAPIAVSAPSTGARSKAITMTTSAPMTSSSASAGDWPAAPRSSTKRLGRGAFVAAASAIAGVVMVLFVVQRGSVTTSHPPTDVTFRPPEVGSQPPVAEMVRIEVPDLPVGTVVTVDGRVASLPIVLPRGTSTHEIGIHSPGRRATQKLEVDATRDREIIAEEFPVALEEDVAPVGVKKPKRKDAIGNVKAAKPKHDTIIGM